MTQWQRTGLLVALAVTAALIILIGRGPNAGGVATLPDLPGAGGPSVARDIQPSVTPTTPDLSRIPATQPNRTLSAPTSIPPTGPPPSPAICHPEHPNAEQVGEAIARHFPAAWQPWACAIAWCESWFNQAAIGEYGEIGIFQIHAKAWAPVINRLGYDIGTVNGNTAMAAYILGSEGPDAWTCNQEVG